MCTDRANTCLFFFWIVPFILTSLLLFTVFTFLRPYALPETGDGSLFELILKIVHLNVPYLLAMAAATTTIHWQRASLQLGNIRPTKTYPIFGIVAIYQLLIIGRTITFIYRKSENYDVYLASLQSLSGTFQYILPAVLLYFYLGSTSENLVPNSTGETQT